MGATGPADAMPAQSVMSWLPRRPSQAKLLSGCQEFLEAGACNSISTCLPLQVSRRSSSRAVSGLSHSWDGLEVLHEAAHSPQGLAPLGQAHLQVTP